MRLDFTGEDGNPVDTVMLLANGGGKTTLSSLVWSVVRPDAHEFIATLRDPTFKMHHYVSERDTGHVALEWEVTPPGSLVPVRWVTGQVFEWKGRRNTGENRDLDRSFYGFQPVAGQLDLDHLPIFDDEGRLRPAAEFKEELRRLGRELGIDEFVVESTQSRWMNWLDDRFLDRELFRQHTVMNGEEGGAANLFSWPDVWSFARTATELLVDDGRLTQVARTVTTLRDKYAERESQWVDLALCKDAVPALHDVADAYDQWDEARRDLATTLTRTARVAGQIVAAADEGAQRAAVLEVEVARLEAAAQAARVAFSRAETRARQARFVAATMRAAAAELRLQQIADAADVASRDRKAWELVSTVHERDTARARLEALDAQLAEADDKVAAAQKRANLAERRYADRLAWDRQEHTTTERQQRDAVKDAEARETAAAKEVERVRTDIAAAERTVTVGADAAETFEQAQQQLVDGELTGRFEPLETATQRLRQTREHAQQQAEQADGDEQAALRRERTLRSEQGQVNVDRVRREETIATAERVTDTLLRRRETLRSDPVLIALADGRSVELPGDAATYADLARTQARDLREQAAAAERDAAAVLERLGRLGEHGIETSADARQVTQLLRDGGVAAVAGWEWLANQPAENRDRFVADDPGAMAGVIVPAGTDAVGRAAAVLDGCQVSEPVTVVTPGAFTSAGSTTGRLVVVPPAERYDPDVAASLRAELEAVNGRLVEQDRELTEDAQARTRLADQLSSWLDAGGTTLDVDLERLDGQRDRVSELTEKLEQLHTSIAAAQSAQQDARQVRKDADGVRAAAKDALRRVEEVIELQRRTGEAQAAAAAAGRRLPRLHDQLGRARNSERVARAAQTTALEAATQAHSRADAIADEAVAQQVPLPDAPSEQAVGLPPRQVLLTVLHADRREVEQLTPDETLRQERATWGGRVAKAANELDRAPQEIATLACELASSAEAATPSGLAAAIDAAKQADTWAAREHAVVEQQLEGLQAAAAKLAPVGRAHHADLSSYPTPTSVEDAEELLERIEGELGGARVVQAESSETASEAGGQLTELKQRVELLQVNGGRLRSPVRNARRRLGWEEQDTVSHVPFEGSTAAVTDAVVAAEQALESASETLDAADELLTEAAEGCVTVAGRHEGDPIVRERLARVGKEAFGARELAGVVALRATTLERELASMNDEREQTVALVAGHVDELLRLLGKLESVSKIPPTIEQWADKPFVKVTLTRPDATELRDRVAAVVDRYLDGSAVPGGLELSIGALKHVLGDRGLKVTLLKPTALMEPIREPVEAFKASDGQKLTAAILLYCTLARLRYEQRGLDPATAGGLLWLDNPFGKASKADLVDLQLSVAKKMGVQLVYLTGIRDFDALAPFSRWTSLGTAANRNDGNAHVVPTSVRRRHAA